jgi:dipeptidyl aminopeptidase/acylaminoacyl peptidase
MACGSWPSSISANQLAVGGVRLGDVRTSGDELYWIELRPAEAGRTVVVHASPSGEPRDITPPDFNARTLVHEYGGGQYTAVGRTVFFSNFEDQRVYRQEDGAAPVAITPEPKRPRAVRFADFELSQDRNTLYCVRETHPEGAEAINEIVALAPDGSSPPRALVTGPDFVAFPRLAPSGRRLAWTQWNHPQMPWDGTELWLADVTSSGELENAHRIAGGPQESIFQPEWSPDGVLHFVSDRSGFWNLYCWRDGEAFPLAPMFAEFGRPQWIFGMATYAFLPDGRIACTFAAGGADQLGLIEDTGGRGVTEISTPYSSFFRVAPLSSDPPTLAAVVASPSEAPCIVRIDVASGRTQVVRRSREDPPDPGTISEPKDIEFPTSGDRTAHALYYAPRNPDCEVPADERPPLVVMSHGGPTSATSSALNLAVQFFTSRGLAVVDVNYGGSTGYGRAYRERLNGNWGVVDTDDCVNAARYLADQGLVDGARMAIRGGSAGGYTTLCALVFHDVFAAGASYYGVADAEALARDTHKFESRYLDSLIGPYPEARELYRQRSPIHFADRLSCPLLILQGLEDEVVPPAQSEVLAEALRKNGLPYAYLAFEGEQHGFRRAENIVRAAEAELSFYARVFGFEPADPLPPLTIENAERLPQLAGGS